MARNLLNVTGVCVVKCKMDIPLQDGETRLVDYHPTALMKAAVQVNKGKAVFRHSEKATEGLAARFATHSELSIIKDWLKSLRSGEEDEIEVIYFLSAHILTEWDALPKKTKAQHVKLYSELADTAIKLSELLQETGSLYYRDGGHGLSQASIADLLTDDEGMHILKPLASFYANEYREFDTMPPSAGNWFPSVQDILYRVAAAADRLKLKGPLHAQPKKRGALNGFFVRRINDLLRQRHGDVPSKILGAIATIALDEIIDDDLAAKHAKLGERQRAK